MSEWVKHLKGLAAIEKNIGKKVAFETSAEKIERLQAKLAESEAGVLDSPAKVGAGTFGVGVKWSTVIEAAKRQYQYAKPSFKVTGSKIHPFAECLEGGDS